MSNIKQIILKKDEEHRLSLGHQWIFSNEIAQVRNNPIAGDVVELLRYDGKFLGLGFYHPNSLIAFRFLTVEHREIDYNFFEERIQQAYKIRLKLYPKSETYRLVHGEGDFLPGLIIDKYNEFFSIQALSTGMELKTPVICDVLESMFHPKAIVARNDVGIRTLEGLPLEKKTLRGNPSVTIIDDDFVKYEVTISEGQKTGFFLDQRENRKLIHRYVKDANVLDCYCNEGGFGLHASIAGAKSVLGLDISESAIAKAKVNAKLNNAQVDFEIGDVPKKLNYLFEKGHRYDAIILDPPSFTKSKKNIPTALKGYREIHLGALKLLNSGGYLITASCSHHISEALFLESIQQAALKLKRRLQLLEFNGASPDHPIIPSMPETKYLKFTIFGVQ